LFVGSLRRGPVLLRLGGDLVLDRGEQVVEGHDAGRPDECAEDGGVDHRLCRRTQAMLQGDPGGVPSAVLVFDRMANGNVAPKRVIKGPKSMVKSPTGVFYDWKNDEVWVSNFGNHTATVYSATADGDVAPKRVIRSAPLDSGTPNIGNAFAPSYDSKRDELIVPN